MFEIAGAGRRGLGDLEAATGQRVEQRQRAVGAGSLPDTDRVLGDQAVPVEHYDAVVDGIGAPVGHGCQSEEYARRESGAIEQLRIA